LARAGSRIARTLALSCAWGHTRASGTRERRSGLSHPSFYQERFRSTPRASHDIPDVELLKCSSCGMLRFAERLFEVL
jgi:hypothetical protein